MSTSFFHEDLLVTNWQKLTRYTCIMYRCKTLTIYHVGGGSGTFWPGAYFDPKYLISRKPIKLQLNFYLELFYNFFVLYYSLPIWNYDVILKVEFSKKPFKKKLTIKIRAIYGLFCVLNISDVIKNT